MKKIFISRELSDDSPFLQHLTDAGHQVHGESLLTFSPIPFENVPATDWLFFYSKKGVYYFFEQFLKQRDLSSLNQKIAAIGQTTATAIQFYTNKAPYFTGTGHPATTAEYFYEQVAGENICFVQARNSKRTVQRMMEGQINIDNLIVYDNVIKEQFNLPHFDILVFTSPMNAVAYFAKYKWQPGQQVLAIGYSTKDALHELGVECYVSDKPYEINMTEACLSMLNQ